MNKSSIIGRFKKRITSLQKRIIHIFLLDFFSENYINVNIEYKMSL